MQSSIVALPRWCASRTRVLFPLLAMMVAVLLTPVSGFAEEDQRVESVDVVLWPEYDKPAVLVMMRVTLPADRPLPTVVTLPVPASAGVPSAVAKKGADGALLMAEHRIETRGDWLLVSVMTDSPGVHLEYYQDLDVSTAKRDFEWMWGGGVPVGQMTFEVQEPPGVEGFTVDPAPTGVGPHPDGLTYHTGSLGEVAIDARPVVHFSYTKEGAALTAKATPPAATPNTGAPSAVKKAAPSSQATTSANTPSGGALVASRPNPPVKSNSTWILVSLLAIGLVIGTLAYARTGLSSDDKDEA